MIAPSILSADPALLMNEVLKVRKADYLHIDVMDGRFVPEITMGPAVIKAIKMHLKKKGIKMGMDAHLMIVEPEKQVLKFVEVGADIITVHAEATFHLHRLLHTIKESGAMAGVAINPATPLSAVEEVIEDLDVLLIMTVNPGYSGQRFIQRMLSKIERASLLLEKRNPEAILEVDGGVNMETAPHIVRAGASMIVAGSAIFRGEADKNLEILGRAVGWRKE